MGSEDNSMRLDTSNVIHYYLEFVLNPIKRMFGSLSFVGIQFCRFHRLHSGTEEDEIRR